MMASSFEAISTSNVIYFNAHNFTFESTSFYFNFFITLFDWLKQLRSLSIDAPFRAIPTILPRRCEHRPNVHRQIIAPSKSIHKLPITSSTNPTPRYIQQLRSKPAKNSFKSLLIVTSLLTKNKQMSLSQQVPEGLKSHDVERGNGSFRPPIPYVPERLDELDPDQKVPTIKIELSNGVESRQPVWDGHGNPENFLCHVQGTREAMEDMGLFKSTRRQRRR
jgi:hypothetical protein